MSDPAPKIIVRGRFQIHWMPLCLAVTGGIVIVLIMIESRRLPQKADLHFADVQPVAAQASTPPSQTAPARDVEISTDVLHGKGVTISEWLKIISESAPGRVRMLPDNLISAVPTLRICEYEGDVSLPLRDALDVLRYAGLAISSNDSDGFDVRWTDSRELMSFELSSSTDPYHLMWGALRRWQHLTLKIDSDWRSQLKSPATLAGIRELAWVVQGEVCRIDIGPDGLISAIRSDIPTSAELDDTFNIFVANVEKPVLAFDAVIGLSAFAISGSPLDLSTRSSRTIDVLIAGLKSSDLEVGRTSAWALGRTSTASALDSLVNTVENVESPAALVSAALVALTHHEKETRRLDEKSMDANNWSLRQAAYQRLRKWLAGSHPGVEGITREIEYARAMCAAAEAFQIDLALPHLKILQLQRDLNQPELVDASIKVAGPGWLHVPFEPGTALKMLRSEECAQRMAASWRWNRQGADSPQILAFDDTVLANTFKAILKSSRSATQRSKVLEALFRLSDSRLGGERRSLCNDVFLAVNAFLTDPSPAVQRSASVIVGNLAGAIQIQALAQADLAVRPRAGTDLLLNCLVQRFWLNNSNRDEDASVALSSLIDALFAAEDIHLAERAAWAKMQNPGTDVSEKLRTAKAIDRPVLRALALKSINIFPVRTEVHSKLVDVFLHDRETAVREAVFDAHLPQLVKSESERTKLYTRGLQDPDASVRLALLNSKKGIPSDSREALCEQIKKLAEADSSKEVRSAATAWLSQIERR